jgi:hypothetical protein
MSTLTAIEQPGNPQQTARPLEPMVFQMRAEFRRSAVYVLVAIALIPAIRWALRGVLPPSDGEPWRTLIPCALLALVPAAAFAWRLRIDSSGIARRRLWIWDLWPWEQFEQGKVLDVEDESTVFLLKEKPLWARKLELALLEDADRERIESIIDRLWVRPALELPAELSLRYGFRKMALIARDGLLLRERGEELRFGWNEVKALRIRRRDHRRRDFKSLDLVLPDRIVTFSVRRDNGQLIRTWSGTDGCATPTAECLAAVLERMIPANRVLVTSLSDAPLTLGEWQDRRSILAKMGRDLKFFRRVIWGAAAIMLVLSLSNYRRGIVPVVGMMLLCACALGLVVLIAWHIERDYRRESAELEAQRPDN